MSTQTGFGKKISKILVFLSFASYDLMSCEVFTKLLFFSKPNWNYLQLKHFAACLAASRFGQNCTENTPPKGAVSSPNGFCGKAPRKFL